MLLEQRNAPAGYATLMMMMMMMMMIWTTACWDRIHHLCHYLLLCTSHRVQFSAVFFIAAFICDVKGMLAARPAVGLVHAGQHKKEKVKVWTLAIAPLTWVRLVTSSALQSQKWQLIGMSQWCRSTLCGHPLPALTDNWTHGHVSNRDGRFG